jgi:hypothetical protein
MSKSGKARDRHSPSTRKQTAQVTFLAFSKVPKARRPHGRSANRDSLVKLAVEDERRTLQSRALLPLDE